MAERRRALEDMALNPDFWAGRSVLITGHTGFKGGWLALWLTSLGARVTGFALAPDTQPSLFECLQLGQRIESQLGDIRDQAAVNNVLQHSQPDVIFHLAAQALVRASYTDPVGTYATNVMGTAHLLDAARRLRHEASVVVVTSDKCYENRERTQPYMEFDPLGGYDPYSSSKACAELAAASWRRSFPGTARIATARAGNVIGGGDWSPDRLLPDTVRAFAAGTEVVIRSPESIRPWQHVLDPLHGYLLLAQSMTDGSHQEAWNFGPDDQDIWTVARLTEQAATLWGSDARWRRDTRPNVHEAGILCLDSQKAKSRLGWRPQLTTQQALATSIEWYQRQQRGDDMQAYSLGQIRQFSAESSPH